MRNVDVHVVMRRLHGLYALGRCYQVHQFYVLAARALYNVYRRNGAAAGSQHRVNDYYVALLYVGRQLAIIVNGLERFRVAVKADVAHLRRGDKAQHAVHHAKAGAENGHYAKLFAGKHLSGRHGNGGLRLYLFKGKIAGSFVCKQHCQLLHQRAKFL